MRLGLVVEESQDFIVPSLTSTSRRIVAVSNCVALSIFPLRIRVCLGNVSDRHVRIQQRYEPAPRPGSSAQVLVALACQEKGAF